MGVDYLRLQCVRGSLPAVCRAVESLVAENGWRRLAAGRKRSPASFYREVCIREESGWVVIDAGEGHVEPWAARVASSLGTTGIAITGYSDEDSIEVDRYDASRRTKHVSHRCGAQRRPVRLPLGFLSDLVPAQRRSSLRHGVLAKPLGSDSVVREIARLAELPRPLATHEWIEEGRLLRFEHAPPPRPARSPVAPRSPRPTQVSFEEAFHVRGVDRRAIERAMKEALAVHDFVPVPSTADPVTWAAGILRVFVHEQRGTLSLGEQAIDDGRAVPAFKWGEILSRRLHSPVLAVWREGDGAEITLWMGGRDEARVGLGSLSDGASGERIDVTALAGFAAPSTGARLRSIEARRSLDRSLDALGDALGLAAPVLAGELDGSELRFRRSGPVDRRMHEEEQSALDWAKRAPNLARLNPLFSDFADLTPEQALRERLKPARRV